MRKTDPSSQERALAERLRREAAESRPEFSETRHGRLCRAVFGSETTKPATSPTPASGWLSRRGVAAALAVAGALAVAVIAWQSITENGPSNRVVMPPPGSDSPAGPPAPAAPDDTHRPVVAVTELEIVTGLVDQATEELVSLVESTETQPQWASLDQNAELALTALNSSVPLDAVASLFFGDATTEAFSESLDP
jgi:hypothetical protein